MVEGTLPYFGSIPFYRQLRLNGGRVLIDDQVPARRHTEINRTRILGANGPMWLSVPLHKPAGSKTPWAEVSIDHDQGWVKDHLTGIKSAYGKAPFFEFYWPEIERLISSSTKSLKELNTETVVWVSQQLGIELETCETLFDTKSQTAENHRSYIQVFEDRFDFTPDLSALDLLFCTGPEASAYLL